MVSVEQEIKLSKAIRTGDKKALDQLTKANLRFVVSVAKQYQYRGLSLSDLINEGNLGLMKAAMRFDETKGFKFISYAVWWIRQSIIQALSEQARLVRLPSNRIHLGNKVQQAFSSLEQMNERAPSTEELAKEMQITEEEVESVSEYHVNYISLDSPNPVTGEESMLESIVDEQGASTDKKVDYTQSLSTEIRRCLKGLSEKERNIVCYFFGIGLSEPLSLSEIATKYRMSGERIRQIKDKAIRHLRTPQKSRLLRSFL